MGVVTGRDKQAHPDPHGGIFVCGSDHPDCVVTLGSRIKHSCDIIHLFGDQPMFLGTQLAFRMG